MKGISVAILIAGILATACLAVRQVRRGAERWPAMGDPPAVVQSDQIRH